MIDTIAFTTSACLLPRFRDITNLPIGWRAKACGELQDRHAQKLDLFCEPIDLHLYGIASHLTSVRANLPKILWGHNARLIKSRQEFEKAMSWLKLFLVSIVAPLPPDTEIIPQQTSGISTNHYTRIDLAWHFPAEAGVFAALSEVKHDKIRAGPSLIKGQTVHLEGSFLEILVYDKVRQMGVMKQFPELLHRVEFRLKGKALKEDYCGNDGAGYSHLPFEWCPIVMRRIAGETHASFLPGGKPGIHQFVADLDHEYPVIRIVDRYIGSQGLTRESARKFRNRVNQLRRPRQSSRSFVDFFPAGDWTTPPELELPKDEKRHHDWRYEYVLSTALTPPK